MEQITRNLYRGACDTVKLEDFKKAAAEDAQNVQKAVGAGKVLGLSLYIWEQQVFLYY